MEANKGYFALNKNILSNTNVWMKPKIYVYKNKFFSNLLHGNETWKLNEN